MPYGAVDEALDDAAGEGGDDRRRRPGGAAPERAAAGAGAGLPGGFARPLRGAAGDRHSRSPYAPGHPAAQAYERRGSVRTSAGPASADGWAAARKWPDGTVHGLCVVLRSRGRTLGVATFLRTPSRRPFDRADADYAEEVAARIAAALDLADSTAHARDRRGAPAPSGRRPRQCR